jgi:hypothetical protein
MNYNLRSLYDSYPILLSAPEIRNALGEFDINEDQDKVFFRKYNHWMDISIFIGCNTVKEMALIIHESLEQKTKEDQMIRLRNYCFFFVFGCIVVPTVMWYAKT